MRPIFSPTEYIQIKGRGTRLYKFRISHTEYDKKNFFLLDFCAVAEYFEETYDYSLPLNLPQERKEKRSGGATVTGTDLGGVANDPQSDSGDIEGQRKGIPTWEGRDTLVSREVRIVGPNGEKVDVMTFRGSFEKDVKDFADSDSEFKEAINTEDDDAVETIMNERFYHKPEMFYSPDKLVVSYGVPAATPAFVYNAVGRKPLPSRDDIVHDTVDSIAARFNLRYNEQKWVDATAQLLADDSNALKRFIEGDITVFTASQFNQLGGIAALTKFNQRDEVFEALRQSTLVRQSVLAARYQ